MWRIRYRGNLVTRYLILAIRGRTTSVTVSPSNFFRMLKSGTYNKINAKFGPLLANAHKTTKTFSRTNIFQKTSQKFIFTKKSTLVQLLIFSESMVQMFGDRVKSFQNNFLIGNHIHLLYILNPWPHLLSCSEEKNAIWDTDHWQHYSNITILKYKCTCRKDRQPKFRNKKPLPTDHQKVFLSHLIGVHNI